MNNKEKQKTSFIEKVGAKLPDINIIFLILTLVVIVLSFFMQGEYNFKTAPQVQVVNFLSVSGFDWIIHNMTDNFVKFAPLGLVLVSVIGTGVAEKTGFFGALIKRLGLKISDKLLIPITIFLGVMSSIASDVGYIILLPLAGLLFLGLNKNPLLGIIAAFAGVSAGFGANLFPTPGDALLGGITREAIAANGIPFALSDVTMNLYFMIASTFLLSLVGWFITVKFVKPFLDKRSYIVPNEFKEEHSSHNSEVENKALNYALISLVIYIIIVAILYFTGCLNAPLDDKGHIILNGQAEVAKYSNLLLDNLIVFMVFAFLIPGLVYGFVTGKVRKGRDYIRLTEEGFKDNAGIILIAFFAGNFINIFTQTGIGKLIASSGAEFLQTSGLNNYPILLLIAFIALTAIINLFMGSASAKWLILAPIFVPLLYQANNQLTPDIIQAAYRIADSSTNIITPLMTYMPIILILIQKFDKKFNIGTMIQVMGKYSIGFLISWTLLLIVFYTFHIPFGV